MMGIAQRQFTATCVLCCCVFGIACSTSGCATTCPRDCNCSPDHRRTVADNDHLCNVECDRKTLPLQFPIESREITMRGLVTSTIKAAPFQPLIHLEKLIFENSNIKNLFNNSFTGLDHLKILKLMNCRLLNMEAGVFMPLAKLEILSLNDNPLLGLRHVGEAFYGLQNSSIKELHLRSINNRRVHTAVLEKHFFYFLKETRIKVIDIQKNQIAIVRPGFAQYMEGLEVLVWSKNILVGDEASFFEVFTLWHLKKLDLRDQETDNVIEPPPVKSVVKSKLDSMVPTNSHAKYFCWPWPPHLEIVLFGNMKSLHIGVIGWRICPHNSMKYLDISNIQAVGISFIEGLNKLQVLDMRNNDCRTISRRFFANLPNLTTALLGRARLGQYFENDKKGSLFSNNKYLRNLDISHNRIRTLPLALVNSLENLQTLKVDNNRLITIDDMSILKHVRLLNVSQNDISSISTKTLENFSTFGYNLTLDITNNPITMSTICCGNRMILVIQWIQTTKVNLYKRNTFTCLHGSHSMNISAFQYRSKCSAPQRNLLVVPLTLALVFLVVTFASLCYRKRLSIAWFIIILRRYTRPRPSQPSSNMQKVYDAFVSYSEKDVKWVMYRFL